MSSVYKVTATDGLRLREKANTISTILAVMPSGTQVTSDLESGGWARVVYNGTTGWASTDYMSLISTTSSSSSSSTGTTSNSVLEGETDQTGGLTAAEYSNLVVSTSSNTSSQLFQRYLRSFGCPPQFNRYVDLQYDDTLGSGVGRRIAETFFLHPSILSICPGQVSYLPGFTSSEKDQFLQKLQSLNSSLDHITSLDNTESGLTGKLYEFKTAYTSYINTVNLLCRATAVFMNLGQTNMPGTSIPLSKFDYGYWTTPNAASSYQNRSIFQETKNVLSTLVTDNAYIHFFVTHQGTSVSESIDTSTTASDLETTFNSSNLSSLARNLEFLFGGTIGGSAAEEDINTIINEAGSSSSFLQQMGKLMKNYLSGGRMVFPQMIDSVGYSKTMSATLKFISPYGDKLSIFLRCYVPILHLLAFTLPKQLSENMYTYPYLVRVFQQGWCNFDLAVISSLRITRGGADETSWTIDGLPTEIEASFDITPLYTNLMSSSANHPFLFLQNTSLAEYLAVMCGVDLKANALWSKLNIAYMALTGSLNDVPTNLARSIIDTKLVNGLAKFFKITN